MANRTEFYQLYFYKIIFHAEVEVLMAYHVYVISLCMCFSLTDKEHWKWIKTAKLYNQSYQHCNSTRPKPLQSSQSILRSYTNNFILVTLKQPTKYIN